ncbi:UvrD-helicase domain-containing protein [Intrasporangium sp. YIM S08009]|uniref:UvrD-helicase domain-containing protein n=1 Tax=Intrasporangium zincisolvens TaxID=3080018 RepID=UPI002B0588F9|nr:UvrD-helicase domain-containing protein [Intrasporangium sp. YIM S08009]
MTTEQVADLLANHPDPPTDVLRRLGRPLTPAEVHALATTGADVTSRAAAANEAIAARTVQEHKSFFDSIETTRLTPEQARAVYTYDNRVHVIAAAGSGKTSVMVGRAAYAVHRGFTSPDRILLLAFNKAAAAELKERIRARFDAAGIPSAGVHATTFHAFGLEVIGHATGTRPSVAPWVAGGQDAEMLACIVAELRDTDPAFAVAWDSFRLLYSRLPDDPDAEPEPDAWDQKRRLAGFATFGGHVVRSHGERMLADWLYLHHVPYEYERPYTHGTVTDRRRQYHPDFYYPSIDVWHEHWGVDADGNPPAHWPGYLEDMAWKRELHRRHGTKLLETTWAGIMDGTGFPRLGAELRRAGLRLRWDPSRAGSHRALPEEQLIRLVRTFMAHVKSNSLTAEQVQGRVAGRLRNRHRAQLFLDLYWRIHREWQARLAAGGYVDFEDMLVQAAEHLEAGAWRSPYDLVMVDEFQDASQARARLTRVLVDGPGRHLLAVGDDWQSINRFAGADVSLVTGFHDYFGPGPDLQLSTTFRCHQSIADAASGFIVKNPAQLAKTVSSEHTAPARPEALEGIHLRHVATSADTQAAVGEVLTHLERAVATGTVRGRNSEMLSVDVLGRYGFDRKHVPTRPYRNLRVTFRTVHAAKGLEADYVIVPNLSSGTYGFPSQVVDDPVLSLAMAAPEPHPHAEERRLLYVALTRARRGVVLIAPRGTPSPFVTELLLDGSVTLDATGEPPPVRCPTCAKGVLTPRQGRYGTFWGCSNFPRCRHTSNDHPGGNR